ncbi:shikimate kinase [Phycisphaerales bacterium AB-hyl4]|uniref:Shikimate kinase n=1 Tax=Natronomicrosphaera hydrolytica TaxID=3242702 RepID=A0ABV4U7S2_9BACT
MNVILIGYRGSGKTTIGKKLANQLWKDFVDVDHEICKRFDNSSIADIWQTHGEPRYREVEVEVTRELIHRTNQVIALGGGTLMQPGAREAVEQAADAKRIYLYADPTVLHRRIEADAQTAATRPALTAQGGGLDEVKAVLNDRDPVYRAVADVVFNVTDITPDEAVRLLVTKHL